MGNSVFKHSLAAVESSDKISCGRVAFCRLLYCLAVSFFLLATQVQAATVVNASLTYVHFNVQAKGVTVAAACAALGGKQSNYYTANGVTEQLRIISGTMATGCTAYAQIMRTCSAPTVCANSTGFYIAPAYTVFTTSTVTCVAPQVFDPVIFECVNPPPPACPANATPSGTACACNAGFVALNGQCVAACTANASRNATGQCVCNAGFDAVNGQCLAACPINATRNATGQCVCNTGFDPFNGQCLAACPINATRNATGQCACNAGYQPLPVNNQCLPEKLTISLAGLGGEVAPTKTRAATATVVKSDGTAKSGAAVSLNVKLKATVPAGSGAAALSPYSGTSDVYGKLGFIFTAPAVGGTHIVTATCTNCTNEAAGEIVVPGCPVDDLPLITDTEVQLFEDNPDRSDTDRLTPRMGMNAGPPPGALLCLTSAIRNAGGTFSVGSAYRPPAYNQHLIDVWKKWVDELKGEKRPACASLRTKIQGHFQRHKLLVTQQPVRNSLHTQGEAVDVTISLSKAKIDTLANGCDLWRPLPKKDPVHFIHK